jgi:hypothetical protein
MKIRVTHLHKSGSGMAAKTACGRNLLRTPISVNFDEFQKEPAFYRCIKCMNSKQYLINLRGRNL